MNSGFLFPAILLSLCVLLSSCDNTNSEADPKSTEQEEDPENEPGSGEWLLIWYDEFDTDEPDPGEVVIPIRYRNG